MTNKTIQETPRQEILMGPMMQKLLKCLDGDPLLLASFLEMKARYTDMGQITDFMKSQAKTVSSD